MNEHEHHPADVERAKRLYPGNEQLQREYLRAMAIVRTTQRGWLLDLHVPRMHTVFA